jgi:hypothetical protein
MTIDAKLATAMADLDAELEEACALARVLNDGQDPPPLAYVFERVIGRLQGRMRVLENAAYGGYGGHDPHGDTQAGAPGGPSRPARKPAKGSLRGSEKLSSLAHE